MQILYACIMYMRTHTQTFDHYWHWQKQSCCSFEKKGFSFLVNCLAYNLVYFNNVNFQNYMILICSYEKLKPFCYLL